MGERAAVLRVDLPAREGGPYDAIVCDGDGEAHLASAALRFGDRPRFLVVDERVAGLHLEPVLRALGGTQVHVVVVPAGEQCKTLQEVERTADKLVRAGVRRDAVLFALGGGATTDLVGFLAAVMLRGVEHVLLPTTLLAMVDAAIGGKTGVNLPTGKNLIGAFHHPRFVLCDLATLATLSPRDRSSGLAEVLKHALLEGEDAVLEIEREAAVLRDGAPGRMLHIVRRAIAYKASVVVRDPRETKPEKRRARARSGSTIAPTDGRAILNLGHTIGHALETASLTGPDPLRHGEAVGLGLHAEARIGAALGLWPEGPARVLRLLEQLGLPTQDGGRASLSGEVVRGALLADKKRSASDAAGRLRFVLLDAPGRPMSVSLDGARALEILLGENVG